MKRTTWMNLASTVMRLDGTVRLLICLAALTIPGRVHAQVNFGGATEVLLFTGGLVGLSVEIVGLIADVKVIIDLAEGQGVRRSWSIVGAAIWGLNFVAAIAGTIGWSLSSQPIGRNLAIAWLALSAASLALNIAGAAKPPTVLPTLIPVAGGVPTPGLMLVGRC